MMMLRYLILLDQFMKELFILRFGVLRELLFEKRIADVLDEFTVILHWSNQDRTIVAVGG